MPLTPPEGARTPAIVDGRSEGEAPPILYSLQVLRGVAALLVMLYHYSHYLKSTLRDTRVESLPFSGGYAGVDIFFVISGFIIVYTTQAREHANAADFSLRRFFRVVPLAQLITLAYFLYVSARPPLGVLWRSLCLLPITDVDPPKFGFPVMPQAWTLPYELYFYALFAAALLLSHRWRVALSSVAVVVSVFAFQWLLGGPITLVPNQVFLPAAQTGMVPPEILGLMGNPILLEFIVGMLLACAFVRFGPLLRHGWAAWASRIAALVLTGVFLHSYLSPLDPGNGLLHKGFGAVCLVVAGLLLEASRPRSLAGPLAGRCLAVGLWLGAISYPLYLIHLGIADKLVRRASSILLGLRVDGVVGFLALAAASLALASAIHVGVERYLIRAGKTLIALRHRRARAAS